MSIVRRGAVAAATVGVLVAVTAAPAAAKGPMEATITDPSGRTTELRPAGDPEPGTAGDLLLLAEDMGLWEAMDPTVDLPADPPTGPGPAFPVAWLLAGPGEPLRLEQTLYPQAPGGPLVHTRPGQAGYDGETGGGWYRASSRLMDTLASLGWGTKHTAIDGGPAAVAPAGAGARGGADAGTGTDKASDAERASGAGAGWRAPVIMAIALVAVTGAAGRWRVLRRRRAAPSAG